MYIDGTGPVILSVHIIGGWGFASGDIFSLCCA